MAIVENKVFLIVGGAGGIGSTTAKEALTCGAKAVAIVDMNEENGNQVLQLLQTEFGADRAIFVKTNISDKKSLEEAFQATVQKYNQLDIVINSAGISHEIEWERTLAINLIAPMSVTYLAMQHYLPKYKSGEEGIVLNVSSLLGTAVFQPLSTYCVSKCGLIRFGQCLGGNEYYKRFKVKVLTVCPGPVNTNFFYTPNPNKRLILPSELIKKEFSKIQIIEEPEEMAKGIIKIINMGSSGSVWAKHNNLPPYELELQDIKTLLKEPIKSI